MKTLQTKEELILHLEEQYSFLRSSTKAYDGGFHGEAKRIAATMRILLHDTSSSTSLLKSLDIKDKLLFYNSHNKKLTSKDNVFIGVGMQFTNLGLKYIPITDKPKNKTNFEEWWKGVMILKGKTVYSRKNVVMSVANVDGGAHIDPSLNSKYANLSRNYNNDWDIQIGTNKGIVENGPELPIVRQCASELMYTLEEQVPNLLNIVL